MAEVEITPEANRQLRLCPLVIQARILNDVIERLRKWPDVSGAKPLKRDLRGNWRIRTGNYRVVFRVTPDGAIVIIWLVGYRGGVYD